MTVWQTCLNTQETPDALYSDMPRHELLKQFTSPRQRILEIGASTGATGLQAKNLFSACEYWGVEPREGAAEIAKTRLDRVLVGKFEDFNLEQEGLTKQSVDGVILADVLEHMYNPWQVLVDLLPYLSANAQVIASIPNLGNLVSLNDLGNDLFAYQETGLYDITHIRFFTLKTIRLLFEETGYQIQNIVSMIHPKVADVYQQALSLCGNDPSKTFDIGHGRIRFAAANFEEISKLCTAEYFVTAVPVVVGE